MIKKPDWILQLNCWLYHFDWHLTQAWFMTGPWSRKMRSPSPSLTNLDLTIEDVFLPAKVSVQCILWLSLVRSAISIERLLNYYHQWDAISMKKIASLLSIDTYVWEAVKIKVLKCYVIFWLAKIFLWEAVKNKRMLCYVIFFDKLKKKVLNQYNYFTEAFPHHISVQWWRVQWHRISSIGWWSG